MKKIILLLIIVSVLLIISCQAVFTFSPISFLKRDITTLNKESQIFFAENALISGDLEEIKESIEEGEMAPLYYRLFHTEARLSKSEKKKIYRFIEDALKLFEK